MASSCQNRWCKTVTRSIGKDRQGPHGCTLGPVPPAPSAEFFLLGLILNTVRGIVDYLPSGSGAKCGETTHRPRFLRRDATWPSLHHKQCSRERGSKAVSRHVKLTERGGQEFLKARRGRVYIGDEADAWTGCWTGRISTVLNASYQWPRCKHFMPQRCMSFVARMLACSSSIYSLQPADQELSST